MNALKKKEVAKELDIKIETYEVEAGEDLFVNEEAKVRYKKQVKDLGLSALVKVLEKEGIIPFYQLSTEETNVWKTFCHSCTKLEDYDKIIPKRVLDILKKAKDQRMFTEYEVWSEYTEAIDPVLVGIITDPKASWREVRYLIARWGDSLLPYKEIKEKAKEKLVERWKGKLAVAVKNRQTELESVEHLVNQFLNGMISSPENYKWD